MATVLLATDGSDLATSAITRAVAALGPDHRYISLAVVPPAFVPTASVSPMETHPTLVDPELEAELEAEQRAESASDQLTLDAALGRTTQHVVEIGEPGPTICEVAAREGAEILVVGSHGHGWLQRVLMGSVSTYVLHHAPCPVLVVRTAEPS
jgi:nucleotide-binding universal stress UspA family protein